jgi:O-succinylbenzoic acid--CoA ligase
LLGGSAAPPALLDEAATRRVPVLTTYGLTEACSQVTVQRYGTRPSPAQGAGHPLAGVSVRIAGGVIQVKGDVLLSGYLAAGSGADPIGPDGWLVTGDLGELDEYGRLHVLARRTDLIVTGGENVYPAEVEQVLTQASGIAAACVFGVADEEWGQTVAAALVASPAPPTDGELSAFIAGRLAPHKRPRSIAYLRELPLTAAGKLDRAAVARSAAGHLRRL